MWCHQSWIDFWLGLCMWLDNVHHLILDLQEKGDDFILGVKTTINSWSDHSHGKQKAIYTRSSQRQMCSHSQDFCAWFHLIASSGTSTT